MAKRRKGCTTKEIKALAKSKQRIGDRAEFELRNMKKALGMFPIMNTPEENQRLKDVKTVLKLRKKCIR